VAAGESENGYAGRGRLREARAAHLEVEVIASWREQRIARKHPRIPCRYHAPPPELHRAGGSGPKIGVHPVPHGDHETAVARDQRTGTLQLPIAGLAVALDVLRLRTVGQTELNHIAQVAQPVEIAPLGLALEVLAAERARIGQERDDLDTDLGRDIRDQKVGARRHRAQQAQRHIGILFVQALE
jgi:hypothetical protein